RHLAVTAGAGTGKTFVLAERYLRILESEDAGAENILAVTFTDKAAGEMKSRVLSLILERFRETAADPRRPPGEKERLERVIEVLPDAPISTIHSMCAALLREFPLNSGVDPHFEVLDERRNDDLERRAVRDVFESLADAGDGDFAVLRNFWDANRCEENIRSLLGEAYKSRIWAETYSKWTPPQARAHLEGLLGSLHESFSLFGCADAKFVHTPRILNALARVLSAVMDELSKRKGRGRRLSFDDLQTCALSLLESDPRAAGFVRARFRYVMVDEFQDVSPMQWKIVRLICPPGGGANLFIVGDEKQSIYSFRGADVGIFGRARAELERANEAAAGAGGKKGAVSRRSRSRLKTSVPLDINFRSHPALVRFFNPVFSFIFSGGRGKDAVEYHPMSPWEGIADDPPDRRVLIVPQPDGGDGGKAERVSRLAGALAGRLRDMIDDAPAGAGGGGSAARFRSCDVAILFRARTHQKAYEQALRRCGIPFVVVGGTGFFDREEVLDVLRLVDFLADPRRDVTLAGLLRSPFFGFSDEDVFRAAVEEGGTLLEKLRNCSAGGAGSPTRGKAERASRLLKEWLDLSGRIPAGVLVRRAMESTGYIAAAGAGSDGARTVANVEKILEMIDSAERADGSSPALTAESLHSAAFGERWGRSREAEADFPLEEDAEGVRLMTIHAAKGLEFPVVVVTGMDETHGMRPGENVLMGEVGKEAWEIGFRMEHENVDARKLLGAKGGVEKPAYEAASLIRAHFQESSRVRDVEEAKRLLYVACTRAKQWLILAGFGREYARLEETDAGGAAHLSGGKGKRPPPRGGRAAGELSDGVQPRWDAWIRAALRAGNAGAWEDAGAEVIEAQPVAGESWSRTERPADPLELIGALDNETAGRTGETGPEEVPHAMKYLRAVHCPPDRGEFAVTDVQTYLSRGEEYKKTVLIGAPGEWLHESRTGKKPGISPLLRGSVVHELYEKIGGVTDEGAGTLFDGILDKNGIDDPLWRDELAAMYVPRALAFRRTETGKKVYSAGSRREMKFVLRVGGWRIRGAMDVLYRDGGALRVLDYKTDRIGMDEVGEKTRDYMLQLQIYVLAALRLFPGAEEAAASLYFIEPDATREVVRTRRDEVGALEDMLTPILAEMTRKGSELEN
ncbi:MAG: UvrD-helicase domain-containing protein, partial [bacterium]